MRGLLRVARESWENGDVMEKYRKKSTIEYVTELQNKIEKVNKMARDNNTQTARTKMKAQYDTATTVRELKSGDEALVLLPTNQNKLFAKWQAPFQVLRKCDDRNNYELQVGNRKAILHLNSLRKFHPPDQDTDDGLNMMLIDAAGDDDETDLLRFPDVPDTTEGVAGRSLSTSTNVYADDGTAPNDFGYATGHHTAALSTGQIPRDL